MIKKIKEKLFTREIITYIIAGVLTTLVNLLASFILYNLLKIDENITTVAAWIIAVIFAYFINNYWVFLEKENDARSTGVKFTKFVGARLLTLILEEGGVYIFITRLGFNFWLIKLILMVLVTILNYIFSKVFIFISGKKK